MSDKNTNVNAESAALYQAMSSATPEQRAELDKLIQKLTMPEGGYLDRMYERPLNRGDLIEGERLLDVLVTSVFAQLVRGFHVDHATIYQTEAPLTDLLYDIRNGILAGIQDAQPLDLLMLRKGCEQLMEGDVNPDADEPDQDAESDELTPDERRRKIEQIGAFYDALNEAEQVEFWREVERARPDLYQGVLEKYIADQQAESDQ